MEECRRMGLKVLGPDINESLKGFAVNKKGEIRFGLGGLKGVGEAAIESIIEERNKKGNYTTIFDMIKRVNQRSVNKKTLESLVYAGAFDCFTQFHRAQYFYKPEGDTVTGLERVIKFGNVFQTQANSTANTLFGDMQMPEITPPRLVDCEPWSLTEQLDHEKEVMGIFISGHPLDNFKFEMRHYGITPIVHFNEFKEAVLTHANPFRQFRLAGLVSDAQHRISRNGKQFGIFGLEDYSGKMEVALFGEDYVRFKDHFALGNVLFLTGNFKTRWNNDKEFEFKVNSVCLLETIKRTMTRQVQIEIHPMMVTGEMIGFFEKNIKRHPGKSSLKFNLTEPKNNFRISMYTVEKGFEMNDEMAEFLLSNADVEVNVMTT